MIPQKQHRMVHIQFAALQFEAQSARALERAENEGWSTRKATYSAGPEVAASPDTAPRPSVFALLR